MLLCLVAVWKFYLYLEQKQFEIKGIIMYYVDVKGIIPQELEK